MFIMFRMNKDEGLCNLNSLYAIIVEWNTHV